ncbi:3-dehydroquinate synthase [Membranicola marinus]|uniref:3-dehydroquinate synthase n=1 Tax=Membranihabitans marinus TaxID=1227546 RepID=A0A953HU55_9BACT|nr:3-dehydroquinate synthase [Membranihabitans marinus]MBY5958266.1 3-dehydroquinate synthase [Membranihabitans marinus]
MRQIKLQDYQVSIGNAWAEIQNTIDFNGVSKCFVLVDAMTKEYCLPLFLEKSQIKPDGIIEIPAGETYKTIETCQRVWNELFLHDADRQALIINLGGGVVGDLGGFVASTYKRGIKFIQVPTTLLSQLDASIGGKVGVDFLSLKNALGVFNNPEAVFINPAFFDTLSDRQLKSGFAEALKHALIADRSMWDNIKGITDLRTIDWEPFLEESLLIKKRIVENDPYEKGPRKALNFGHTIGHAIEGVLLETEHSLLHGEAVLLGMIAESKIAQIRGLLNENELSEITNHLRKYVDFSFDLQQRDMIINLIKGDKKNEGDKILCTLLNAIGQYAINQDISLEEVEVGLIYLEEQFDYSNV